MKAKLMNNLAALLFFLAGGIYIGMIYAQYSHGHGVNKMNLILCVVFLFIGLSMLIRARSLKVHSQVGDVKRDE